MCLCYIPWRKFLGSALYLYLLIHFIIVSLFYTFSLIFIMSCKKLIIKHAMWTLTYLCCTAAYLYLISDGSWLSCGIQNFGDWESEKNDLSDVKQRRKRLKSVKKSMDKDVLHLQDNVSSVMVICKLIFIDPFVCI